MMCLPAFHFFFAQPTLFGPERRLRTSGQIYLNKKVLFCQCFSFLLLLFQTSQNMIYIMKWHCFVEVSRDEHFR